MMLSVVLSTAFTVTAMILKYQSGEHELTNDMMKMSERGRNCEIQSKSKPDDFHAKYEQYDGRSGLIGFCRFYKEGHPGLREQFCGACEGRLR